MPTLAAHKVTPTCAPKNHTALLPFSWAVTPSDSHRQEGKMVRSDPLLSVQPSLSPSHTWILLYVHRCTVTVTNMVLL